ncbi:MAG: hypothetical protein PHX38_09340 [Sulfuricella sp.]|nr:hypothetical protein [Sulfuricella sp.]
MFAAAAARMNASIMAALGRDDVSIRGDGYDESPRGIFVAPWSGIAIGNMMVDRPDPVLVVLTPDLAKLGGVDPQPGDQAEIGSTIYTIVSAKDVDGFTEMTLRLYV